MKTKFNIILLMLFCLGLASCEDYLDVNPEFGLSEDIVFSNYETLSAYLDNCYVVLNDELNWTSQNRENTAIYALSDEAGCIANNSNMVEVLNTGAWSNQSDVPEIGWYNPANRIWRAPVYSNATYSIRIANKVLETLEGDLSANLTEDQKNEIAGQAYFFRAWYYFQIIQRFGGMPLLDKAFSGDDNTDLDRLTYSESSEWLISDLEKAIGFLPDRWSDIETGRITKGAALALKSMAALYAASPLMQNDLNSIQYSDYGQAWAERAAEYASDALKYIASGAGGSGPSSYRLMDGSEYQNIFYYEEVSVSDEQIWYRQDMAHKNRADKSNKFLYLPRRFAGGNSAIFTNPTQNIVDKFEVINNGIAYPIDDPRSGYDSQNPYANRDPRFYNNIIIPGEEWGVDKKGKKLYQELYVDGIDYKEASVNSQTNARDISGYMCKKYIWPEAVDGTRQWTLYNRNMVYIRVAQVYLDYAEAMNEAYGPTADPKGYGLTAVQAINVIRNRVGLSDVLIEFTASKTDFRDKIRDERAVELMWENHRWFDLRRWMIAEDVLGEPIRGVKAIPPSNHKSVKDKSTLNFTFEYFDALSEQRVFNLRHYWYPLPATDVQDLFNYKQNPGW